MTIATHRPSAWFASVLALLICQLAAADVSVTVEEGGRVQVTADQASNGDILESLARELDFSVVVEDAAWSAQERHFERAGSPERVLKALLGSTNHLLSYRGDAVSGVTVLAEGAGAAQLLTSKSSSGPVAVDSADTTSEGWSTEADEAGATPHWKRTHQTVGVTPQDAATEEEEVAEGSLPKPTPISSLLQSRAQAATQHNKPPPASQSQEIKVPDMEPPVREGIPAGIDLAELARLTQQAHQDVQNMAEQLRRAEAQMKANQP